MAGLWISAQDTMDPNGPFTHSAIRTASWILYKLTAEKYPGTYESTEMYGLDQSGFLQYMPIDVNGQITNMLATHRHLADMTNMRIHLRNTPVLSVTSVSTYSYTTGITTPFTDFELRNNSFLVRTDGLKWLTLPQEELQITYKHGTPPPSAGRRAATRLANELIMAETGNDMCALPDRVTSITRQGVSYTVLDPQTYINQGKTGIYEIDMFITAANPTRAFKRPKIWVPGTPSGEKRN